MNEFRTVLNPSPANAKIGLKDAVLTVGSCFSDAIGHLLATYKIDTCINPFGTVYNPHSIHNVLRYAIQNQIVSEDTFVQSQEVYRSYDFHSDLAALNEEALSQKLHTLVGATHAFIKKTNWLLITYGTAWVYKRNDNGAIVANCHKQPATAFTKSLLSTEDVMASFQAFYQQLKAINPYVNIILTVSPVRHIKDTLPLNAVSKSVLRLACHYLSDSFSDVYYFPAYEIVTDDLRDYRFYNADMIHPSPLAEDYIWTKFTQCFGAESLTLFIPQWKEILTALAHKPFHPETQAHQRFLLQLLQKLKNLQSSVNVDFEMKLVQNQIKILK